MHMKLKKWMMLLFAILIISSVTFSGALPAGAASGEAVRFKGETFGQPVDLGVPVSRVAVSDAVVGKEDGRDVFYTTVNGDTAIFNVVDVMDNKLIRSFPLDGTQQSWRHTIAPDGTVYIGGITTSGQTKGDLWAYSPLTKTVQNLGEPIKGEKSIWTLTTDEKGNVYGGTFQSGKVFKYDPVNKKFRDYGSMVQGQEYVRSIAYHEGYVYAGIGTKGDVVRLNVETGEKQVISDGVAALLGVEASAVPFAYDMTVVNELLVVKFGDPAMTLLFYDLITKEWLPHKVGKDAGGVTGAGVFSFNQLVARDNKLYVPANGHVTEVNLDTFETRLTAIKYGTSFRGAGWVEFDTNGKEQSFATMKGNGDYSIFNVVDETIENFPSVLQGQPNPIHNIEQGPDEKLYMSGYPGGIAAQFDPVTLKYTMFVLEQAEGMIAHGNDMYFGVYPGGHVYKADTTQSVPKAEKVFTIGDHQDRPYIMKTMEDKIMIGTIPDYGQLGGALTIYDPVTDKHEVFRDIVKNQSIVGLAYKDGYIYGSTTVHGGLGISPSERSAKMFVWDVANKKKVTEFTLDIPGLSNPPMISGLTVGLDGNIWGGVNGILFKLDPKTYELIDYKNIYSDINNYGMWRPYHSYWSKDGLLYMDLADRITIIDPKTMDHVRLVPDSMEVKFMNIAKDANGSENIYYADASSMGNLMMIPISDAEYENAGQLKLAAPASARPGQTVSMTLQMEQASQLYGFKAKIQYETDKWEVVNVSATEAWKEQGYMTWANEGGILTLVGTQLKENSINGDASLAEITLKAIGTEGDTVVTLLKGAETIRLDGDQTGHIDVLGQDKPVKISIGLPKIPEDFNGDGKVDVLDLMLISKQVGLSIQDHNRHMDLNGDGKIDVADMALVGLKIMN
ncbi:cohesin domain-containing protein [Paenibacillus sp. N3/727]|uniref:cohesin domain-containing protein n=1 Tax=Paenibacillus sp. N3/727 TaxID=2925845 RepID=UPI001F5345EA|nr:cohesin domain-containing protein [Paenibacillus sp. N3/727]UNK17343.1 cohesin domain-containing protein [Paenibacillus sp. N3/727]